MPPQCGADARFSSAPSSRGKHDHVFFSIDQTADSRSVAKSLVELGGVQSISGKRVLVACSQPVAAKPTFVDRSPVFLTDELTSLIHEPVEGDPTVAVDMSESKILRPESEWPPPDPKWDGVWHGTESSRIKYLRENRAVWAFCRPAQVKRRTACFFIPKKDGLLRKILACCNCNNVCVEPRGCYLPGPWVMQKMRFRGKRFMTAEGDVSSFYSRLAAEPWLKYFLCLADARAEEVFDLKPGESFVCPVTGEEFFYGDIAVPCWPRIPMGWSWSVALSVELAIEILQEVLPRDVVSLNVHKHQFLRSAKIFAGVYIDNILSFGEEEVAEHLAAVHTSIEDAFIARGLPLSQRDPPTAGKKVLGIRAGPATNLRPPEEFSNECMFVAGCTSISFRIFERQMGRCAWLMPLSRFFFSLMFSSFELLAHCRRVDMPAERNLRLSKLVRAEFRWVATLGEWLKAELQMDPADSIFACDASLSGWAITECQTGSGFIPDSGVTETPFETQLLRNGRWRPKRVRKFRQRLSHCLQGEICAFRQTATIAARRFPGKDLLIFTDNTNVYHSTKKGRSGVRSLNDLCRHLFLLEVVHGVKFHPRWCSTHSMPADRYTRL